MGNEYKRESFLFYQSFRKMANRLPKEKRLGFYEMIFEFGLTGVEPKETGDYADLAKMQAGLEMARRLSLGRRNPAPIFRETRTGIESLSADMTLAKWQLARSTFLQMCMDPHIIHIVSYCEANYAARPADIIDSSRLIRRAVKIFRQHKGDIMKEVNVPIVNERREYLIKESSYLVNEIAKLHPQYQACPIEARN